jgi:hypothetical protein
VNKLYFKRTTHDPGMGPQTVDVATRSSDCVPRPGEFVCLNQDDASYIVERVEHIMLEAPEGYYNNETWIWLI